MELHLPAPPGSEEAAVWTGSAFHIGGASQRVLAYDVVPAGWSEDLTELYLDDNGGEDHYINVASRENAIRALGQWITEANPRIIDIGCASGYTLQALRQRFPAATVLGADSFIGALSRVAAKLPDVPLLQFDLAKCPLPDNFVDAAVVLNVLEHIEDDDQALRHLFRILRPKGIACIEVPAGADLYDIYDKELQHFRRYNMRELTAKLKKAGFEILDRSHLGFFVFPAFWAVKKRNRRAWRLPPDQQKALVMRNINASGNIPFMDHVMTFEKWLRDRVYLPFGIRCVVVCRRP